MPPNYVATAGPIRWRFMGDFILHHPTDTNKYMSISVDLQKALMNTSDPVICDKRKPVQTYIQQISRRFAPTVHPTHKCLAMPLTLLKRALFAVHMPQAKNLKW